MRHLFSPEKRVHGFQQNCKALCNQKRLRKADQGICLLVGTLSPRQRRDLLSCPQQHKAGGVWGWRVGRRQLGALCATPHCRGPRVILDWVYRVVITKACV